ncbi:MAG: hypothetical protein AAFU41_02225 [Pseudomonadota bacterium]
MKNVTPFPDPALAASSDVVVLSCPHQMHFDHTPLLRLFSEKSEPEAEEIVCRMLEDIAFQLDLMQKAIAAHTFADVRRPAKRIELVADQIGLMEVAIAASHVGTSVKQGDGVAMEATMARLERGFDLAVSEIWSFRQL